MQPRYIDLTANTLRPNMRPTIFWEVIHPLVKCMPAQSPAPLPELMSRSYGYSRSLRAKAYL